MKSYIPFRPDARSILWHYANGRLPMWTDGVGSPIGWITYSHRGVQFLDKLRISSKQKRKVRNGGFDLRIDTAFMDVVRACAEARAGQTWITPDILRGCEMLYDLGCAHSYEAWADGALVGGAYGIHLGGYATIESIFHKATNAGSAAQIHALLHMQERGFRFVDTNGVPPHVERFGAEWIAHWQFMELLKQALAQQLSINDARPCQPLSFGMRAALRAADIFRKVGKCLAFSQKRAVAQPGIASEERSSDHVAWPATAATNQSGEPEYDALDRAA